MPSAKPETVHMPLQGVIVGGRLHGWRYKFLSFRMDVHHHGDSSDTVSYYLKVLARCSAPGWPFPCEIPLKGGDHYETLRAVPGDRAKRVLAAPLVAIAYREAGLELPAYWAGQLPAPR